MERTILGNGATLLVFATEEPIRKLLHTLGNISGNEPVNRRILFLTLLAIVVAIVNAIKPIHIDDTYYIRLAQHITSNPLDPFGFEIFWQQWPAKVYEGFVPPLLPYWLALSMSVFGDNPFLLKLSMLPFILVFTMAIFLLGKRFAPSLALPMTAFTALSPAVVPSWNVMQDLPCIGLGLIAIEVFIRSVENGSWKYALAAGVLASLAVMTKYTALVVPGVMLLYGLIYKRWTFGIGAGFLVLGVIVTWECLHYLLYGHTQLLWGITQGLNVMGEVSSPAYLSVSALMTVGALSALLMPMYLPMGKVKKSFVIAVVLTVLVVYGAYASIWFTGRLEFVCLFLGVLLLAAIVTGFARGLLKGISKAGLDNERSQIYLFLLGWLALEIVGYFLMSPFAAVRRILVISIILAFVGFRNLDSRLSVANRKAVLIGCWLLVTANIFLSGFYYWVDFKDSNAQKSLLLQTAEHIRSVDAAGTIWYVGHWGFAYYAEKEKMKPVVPESSLLKMNDWLVVSDRVHGQKISLDDNQLVMVGSLEVRDRVPVFTVSTYYSGPKPLQLKFTERRLQLYILRVKQDFRAATDLNLQEITEYIASSPNLVSTLKALPALLKHRYSAQPETRKIVVDTLTLMSELAFEFAPIIAQMANDGDAKVREAVMNALTEIGNNDPHVIEAIDGRLADSSPEVRFAAQAALDKLAGKASR